MSWEALNWAGDQRTRAASTQCVLYVIANAADPDGVAFRWWDSPEHWWTYLVQKTRLKRAALFRILAELEEAGLLARENGPSKGGPRQPLVRLLGVEKGRIIEAEPAEESTTETDETARPPENAPSQSTTETESAGMPAVESPPSLRPSLPHRPASLCNPTNPSTNPKPLSSGEAPKGIQGNEATSPSQALKEPIGFGTLISSGPSPELVQRPKALKAFVALDETSRRRAIDRWPLYGAASATARKKPRALHLWLAERGFDNAGAGAVAAGARRVFVAQNSPQWHAWLAAFASGYGGELRVPAHLSGSSRGGILVASEWPSGGERWIVPRDHWVFVEHGTSQHAAWAQRIGEIFHRAPTLVRAAIARDHHRKIGRGDHGALKEWNGFGLFVPSEWPPRKTEAPTVPDDQNDNPESLMSEEDMNERF